MRVLGKLLRLLQGELHCPSWIVEGLCVVGRRLTVWMLQEGNIARYSSQ
jgi:hypothetical protein